jgi:osmotically inducible protein OsmC
MPTRIANAHWEGDFKRGGGTVAVASGLFEGPYNFSGRFEDGTGTNPEELLGAAHAACFAMALSVGLTQAGTPPESLDVEAKVTIDQVEGGFGITRIDLDLKGKVPGIDEAAFNEAAAGAKAACPLSKALAAVPEINLTTTFET